METQTRETVMTPLLSSFGSDPSWENPTPTFLKITSLDGYRDTEKRQVGPRS